MTQRFSDPYLLIYTLIAAFSIALLPVRSSTILDADHSAAGNAKDLFLIQLKNPGQVINNGFSYTVELHRPNQVPVMCSPGSQFFSGDGIKVRIKSNFRGYTYIVLAQGSTGKQTLLFPPPGSSKKNRESATSAKGALSASTQNNLVTPDREYVIPERGVIRFDNNPGVERLLFILSRKEIDLKKVIDSGSGVSVNRALDDASLETPGIAISRDSGGVTPSGVTYVVKSDPSRVVYVEVALNHISASTPGTGGTGESSTPGTSIGATMPATTVITPPPGGTPPDGSTATMPGAISLLPSGPSTPIATVSPPGVVPTINRPVTDKWAVVIGLSKYRDSNMNLKAPHKDAETFADFLTNEAGFMPSHVIRIYDQEATRANILASMEQVGRKVRPDDLFVFYANCHGSANTETPGNFLLLYDYNGEGSMDRQLLMQDLSNLLKSKVPSERIVLIVQACHSGFVKAGSVPSAEAVSNDLQGIGRIVATACTGSESSWVYRRGGIFTMALIPNLRKYPRLKEALMHTRSDVMKETKSEEEKRQMHPVIKYDLWMGDDAVLMVKPTDPQP